MTEKPLSLADKVRLDLWAYIRKYGPLGYDDVSDVINNIDALHEHLRCSICRMRHGKELEHECE